MPTGMAQGSQAAQPGGMGIASFTVNVPAPGAGAPIPQSVVVTLASSAGKMAPLTMNLTASTSGCKAMIGGGLTCIASVSAPTGPDAFVVTTYAGSNGSGARITTVQTSATVNAFNHAACTPKAADLVLLQKHN
jgi:hypothetical protein